MTSVAFRLKGVVLRFPTIRSYSFKDLVGGGFDSDKPPALSNLTFEIGIGERVGLVGNNGAGKSTLLRVLAGIYPISDGEVRVFCNPGSFLSLGVGLNNEMTASQHIKLKAILLGYEYGKHESKFIDSIIDYAELRGYEAEPLRTFSSGMLARLEFSILIHSSFDFMLMDEWLSVGDSNFRAKAKDSILRKMNLKGCGLVLASHDHDLVSKVCDRTLHLDGGRVVASK